MKRLALPLFLSLACCLNAKNLNNIYRKLDPDATIAISVKKLNNRKEIVAENSNAKLIPASTLKLITLAAVFEQLGPNFRFTTDFFWNGSELRIKGSGDPAISDRYSKRNFDIFKKVCAELKKRKITEIRQITADNSLFTGPATPPDWEKFDKTYYYAPEISALSFNDNSIELLTDGTNTFWKPFNTNYIKVTNNPKIVAANKNYVEDITKNQNHFTLKSSIPINTTQREFLAISNPAAFTIHSLRHFLFQNKIDCGELNVYNKAPDYSNFTTIYSHQSPPLSTLITTALHNSNNFFTEMLTRSATANKLNKPISHQDSIKFTQQFLQKLNLPETKITDNCGLSRTNRLSTHFLTEFLIKLSKQSYGKQFIKLMPLSGQDRPLKFLPKSLKGRIRAKTGSMSGVYTLCGYIDNSHSFAIIINNSTKTRSELKGITATIISQLATIAEVNQ